MRNCASRFAIQLRLACLDVACGTSTCSLHNGRLPAHSDGAGPATIAETTGLFEDAGLSDVAVAGLSTLLLFCPAQARDGRAILELRPRQLLAWRKNSAVRAKAVAQRSRGAKGTIGGSHSR